MPQQLGGLTAVKDVKGVVLRGLILVPSALVAIEWTDDNHGLKTDCGVGSGGGDVVLRGKLRMSRRF